jgi:hypothetical protein
MDQPLRSRNIPGNGGMALTFPREAFAAATAFNVEASFGIVT